MAISNDPTYTRNIWNGKITGLRKPLPPPTIEYTIEVPVLITDGMRSIPQIFVHSSKQKPICNR